MKKIFTFLFSICALTSLAQVNLTQNLEAFYPFNGNAFDESTNSNDGIVYGATLTKDRFGNDNSAYSFGGADYIELPLIIPSGDYSVALWVKTANDETGGMLYMNGRAGQNGLGIIQTGTSNCVASGGTQRLTIIAEGVECDIVNSTYNLPSQQWTFIVMTKNGSTVSLYVNGTLKHTGTDNSKTPSMESTIGKFTTSTIIGDMDDIRVYSRVINQDEIDALYADKSTSSVNAVNIAAQVLVYPNPSNGVFTIELPKQGANLTLLNAQGVTVKQFNNFSETKLQVADLPKGMYILRTEIDGYTAHKKIIVQ